MKLLNSLIIALGNNGLANTSEHELPGDEAYKSFRFRRSAMKVYMELAERQAELKKDAAGDNERYKELNAALLKDTSEVWATPLAVKDYLVLSAENRHTPVPGTERTIDFYRAFENDLEGILWADETD